MNHDKPFNKTKSRPPLITLTELSEEFGVPKCSLKNFLAFTEGAPEAKIKIVGSRKNSNTWYNPTEVRAWWKQFLIDRPDVREKLNK